MPVLSRKRRAPATTGDAESQASTPQPSTRDLRRRSTSSGSVSEEDNEEETAASSQQQLVKNFVRYALACEHTRTPIRRNDVLKNVLGTQGRQFKPVFESAQTALRTTFGMELIELPVREKLTLKDKRAAQKSQSQSKAAQQTNSNQWILCTTLPPKYRSEDNFGPAKVPTTDLESAYIGLYSFIITVITAAGGQLPRQRLERILRRMNADQNTPVDATPDLLKRMEKQGYIVRLKEQHGGEETEDFIVGPRGRTEIGNEGVAGLVRSVFAHIEEGSAATEEMEQKLARTLKVASLDKDPSQNIAITGGGGVGSGSSKQANGAKKRGRPRRPENEGASEDD